MIPSQAEKQFLDAQQKRRQQQVELQSLQLKLRTIHTDLDKTSRGDERYLELLTEEHKILRSENSVTTNLENEEENERGCFAALSSAVRESHEKERQRTERTKYWSLIGSVTGVVLGIVGSSLNNYLRMKEMRRIVTDQAKDNVELQSVIRKVSDAVVQEKYELQQLVSQVKTGSGIDTDPETIVLHKLKELVNQIIQTVEESVIQHDSVGQNLRILLQKNDEFSKDIIEVKQSLRSLHVYNQTDEPTCVIPLGGLEEALEKSEKTFQAKLKSNTIWTVTIIYAGFALTMPVLFYLFKSN